MHPPFRLQNLKERAEICCCVKECFPHTDSSRAPDSVSAFPGEDRIAEVTEGSFKMGKEKSDLHLFL